MRNQNEKNKNIYLKGSYSEESTTTKIRLDYYISRQFDDFMGFLPPLGVVFQLAHILSAAAF